MEKNKKIIVYDEGCNLCTRSVSFIRKHDRENTFTLIPFQSEAGRRYAMQQNTDPDNPHSVLLVDDGIIYDQSTAGLKIAEHLQGTKLLSSFLRFIPRKFNDWIYRLIARHRRLIFGRNDSMGK